MDEDMAGGNGGVLDVPTSRGLSKIHAMSFGKSQGQNYHGERYGHGLRRTVEVEACLVDLAEADRNAAVNSELKAEEFQHTLFLVTTYHSLARVTPQVFQHCLLHIPHLEFSRKGGLIKNKCTISLGCKVFHNCHLLHAGMKIHKAEHSHPIMESFWQGFLLSSDHSGGIGMMGSNGIVQAEQGQCNMQYAKFEHFPYVPSWDPM
ncbi:hypothetical protein BGW80DRAFT_1251867 [Lactifluus volemus]|nr:hypothetical protein BGW80DRAFT_1251867 [Lactifluus volemus]